MAKLTDKEITDALARGETVVYGKYHYAMVRDSSICIETVGIGGANKVRQVELRDLLTDKWEEVKNG